MSDQMEKSIWDSIEKIAKVLSLVAIPIVIAVIGWFVQDSLKTRDVSKEYVNMALGILTSEKQSKVHPDIRAWAVDLLIQHSPTPFAPDVARRLKIGELTLTESIDLLAAGSSGSMAISPDGVLIAAGTEKGQVLVFDGQTTALRAEIRAHQDRVSGVAFSPDQKLLATGSFDNTVRIWLLSDLHAPPKILTGHHSGIMGVAFSPDSRTLYSRSFDGTIMAWDVEHGRPTMQLRGPGL